MLSNNVLSYKPRAIVFLNKLKFLRWQQKSTDNVAAMRVSSRETVVRKLQLKTA
jgi:hypothetical protein